MINITKKTKKSAINEQHINKILGSGLFDKNVYEKSQGVEFDSVEDAIVEYLTINTGTPSVLFDHEFYLQKYPDIAEAGVNPLLHYIEFGAKEQRMPSALFFPSYFLSQIKKDHESAIPNPLVYYLHNPLVAKPCALFDGNFYHNKYKVKQHPFVHYLMEGWKQGCNPHPLFETEFVYEKYQFNRDCPALVSYMRLTNKANGSTHPLFDAEFYVQVNKSSIPQGMDAISHYIVSGSGSHFWPNKLFWTAHYEKQLIKSELDNCDCFLSHYVTKGYLENITPNPWFDNDFYIEQYPWTKSDTITPLEHYMYDGWRDDLLPSENFISKFVRSNYKIDKKENPLSAYVLKFAGQPTMPQKAWSDPVTFDEQKKYVIQHVSKKSTVKPQVSVVVPVFNSFEYTIRCLYSMLVSNDKTAFEIIVADDQSSDETQTFFSSLVGLTYIRNPKNLGFLLSCNNAAKKAKGEYIFFLNNDTAVLDGWLDRLVQTFVDEKKVGLVGSKLLYPNGVLQEAGGILWNDGSASNYGKLDDPLRPEYSYLRDVDYVSGAAILLPTTLWNELDGFDERYVPAYCEDSDLCLQIRDKGLRVLMQPASKIVHFEGISNGKSLNSGIKKYQVNNSKKLLKKWASLLKNNGSEGDVSRACVNRSRGSKILIIDATFPTPDQDAGSLTVWNFLKIFRTLGIQITFLPENLLYMPTYTENIQALGVEAIYGPYVTSVESYVEQYGNEFDVVMLYRVNSGGKFFETIRKFCPKAKIIFDTVDIHFLRQERQAKLEKDKDKSAELMAETLITKDRELYLLKYSDNSIVLSEYEKVMLKRDYGVNNTFVVPIVLDVLGSQCEFEERKDVAFIGGYQHTPNVDAVLHFVEDIWPRLKKEIPNIKFYVVGSKPPQEVLDLAEQDADIIVTGYIENIDAIFNSIRLTVAPLRFGAGIKGKIGTSLSYGVPCVATKVAAEGMGLIDNKNISIAQSSGDFADKLIKLYNNKQVWNNMSKEGINFIEQNYSVKEISKRLQNLFNSIGIHL